MLKHRCIIRQQAAIVQMVRTIRILADTITPARAAPMVILGEPSTEHSALRAILLPIRWAVVRAMVIAQAVEMVQTPEAIITSSTVATAII